jgi:hypothetical protein
LVTEAFGASLLPTLGSRQPRSLCFMFCETPCLHHEFCLITSLSQLD